MDRTRPSPVPYLAGIPRYRVGRAARGVWRMLTARTPRRRTTAAAHFEDELACWDLAGFFWGKHVHRVAPATAAGNQALEREHLA
jgi:hypothetical protein